MKLPYKRRADDWVFGALLASVLAAAVGLQTTWLHEARPAATVARAPAAPATLVAAAPRHTEDAY
ncbi:MAG TPA: hypothetical protein VMU47_01015 [Caldimonas sp.]|nr:hypothetical protein [Caldimonas sp.]